MTLQDQKDKIIELANKHTSSQIERYKDSIFMPYITLPNAKGKGAMMEEFFAWYFNQYKIKTDLKKTNENYDFVMNNKWKVELKVASIGYNNMVVFNQIHYGIKREVDKFLLIIIRPDDKLDMFLIDKKDFLSDKIKVQKQHSNSANECARICWKYDRMLQELSMYRVTIGKLYEIML